MEFGFEFSPVFEFDVVFGFELSWGLAIAWLWCLCTHGRERGRAGLSLSCGRSIAMGSVDWRNCGKSVFTSCFAAFPSDSYFTILLSVPYCLLLF